MSIISPHNYSNPTQFFQDKIKSLSQNPSFSYRQLLKKAHLSSTNYISMIMQNKRQLGLKAIKRLSKALNLPKKDKLYLINKFLSNKKEHIKSNHSNIIILKKSMDLINFCLNHNCKQCPFYDLKCTLHQPRSWFIHHKLPKSVITHFKRLRGVHK